MEQNHLGSERPLISGQFGAERGSGLHNPNSGLHIFTWKAWCSVIFLTLMTSYKVRFFSLWQLFDVNLPAIDNQSTIT